MLEAFGDPDTFDDWNNPCWIRRVAGLGAVEDEDGAGGSSIHAPLVSSLTGSPFHDFGNGQRSLPSRARLLGLLLPLNSESAAPDRMA